MAKRIPKEESKKEKVQESTKLKDVLKELELSPDEVIYIHKHNVYGDEKYLIKDIENSLLNKKVMGINQHYDSVIHGSDGLRFIIE